MKKFRKLISIVMAVVMLVTMLPMVVAGAAEGAGELELNTPVELLGDGTTYVFTFSPEYDGWYVFYSEGGSDPYATLMSNDYDEIDYDDDFDEYNFAICEKLYAGYTYILEVSSMGNDYEPFSVTVEETAAAESIEIIQEPYDTTVIEGFEYDTLDPSGLEIEFTMTDGSIVRWSYDDRQPVGYEYVTIERSDDGMGHYYIDIICGEAFERYFFTTVESPITSIEYKSDEAISYYVDSYGYYDDDLGYYIYDYDIPEFAQIVINYKDGSSETVDFYGDTYFDVYTTQYTEAWGIGTNYLYISYLGFETEVPVEILPCPFVNVTLNQAPENQYVLGDSRYGYFDEYNGKYYLYPNNFSGISFTVEYADGSTQTYTEEDFDDMGLLDGYVYDIEIIPCDAVGDYKAVINYKGYRIEYDIEVVETPIAGIELTDAPDNYVYDSYFYPVFDGAQIKLTFKDGTTKYIDITEDNTTYECYYGGFEYLFTDGEYEVYASYNYTEENGEFYTFSCLGYEYDYFGIEFEDVFFVDYVEFENIEHNRFDAKVVDIFGVVREYSIDALASFEAYGYFEGCAKTEEGILFYTILEADSYYEIFFMGEYYEVPREQSLLGDVNGDGDINIMDATAIQLHIASIEELDDSAISRADVDKNGNLTIMDTTFIQLYIAELIEEF